MKDDTSTPIGDSGASPNEFESDKPKTSARTLSEQGIEKLRLVGGVFVDAVRATRMPMALTDPNLPGDPIVFANEAFLKLSGYRMEEVLGQQPYFMNGPETDSRDAARFAEMIRADQDDLMETVQYRKNGTRFVATVLLSAFKGPEGNTLDHFMSWLDVTRRVDAEVEVKELRKAQDALRESEQHQKMLLAELQHRVRNTLAVVRSIARRTADRSTDMDTMVSHFEGRLGAFARVQSVVTRSPSAGLNLKSLIDDELLAVSGQDRSVARTKGPEILFKSRAAESLSLAIHELATNAVKYGALSAEKGRVRVSWKRQLTDGIQALQFEWIETGLEDAPKPTREGFGHELLLRSLPYDLQAETSIEFTNDGLRFTMTLPLNPDIVVEAGEG